MIKGDKRNGSDMRNGINAKSENTVIAVTTISIPMRKNRRTKTIGIPTDIIKEGIVMAIDVRPLIAEDSMDRDQMHTIDNIGTNVAMTRVRKMSGVRSHTGNTDNHRDITGDFSKIRRSKPYPRRQSRQHRQEEREVRPVSTVSYASNPDITQRSVHIAKARNPL